MTFEHYMKKTRETAVYPEDYERDYVIHGLVDELGELRETVDNPPMARGLRRTEEMSGSHVAEIEKEMGDVTWYLARVIDHFDFDFPEYWNTEILVKPLSPEKGKELVQEALLSAARINGHQKKSVRDGDNREDQIQHEVGEILRKIRKAAHHFGLRDLDVVTRRNLDKLFDRKDRGKLHGDGDDR